ncbi:MAG: hypothetical protein ACHREM_02585 [Polyangiales bacterium]
MSKLASLVWLSLAGPLVSTTGMSAAPFESRAATAASAAPSSSADPDADATESATPIALKVVMPDKPTFPKSTAPEAECWSGVPYTGSHQRDFPAIIDHCGPPPGLVEYVTPVEGRLHSVKDKVDTFTVKLRGGFCYRIFAVADDGIKDLDVMVLSKDGALIADDRTTSPIAILDYASSWCQSADLDVQLQLMVDGDGKGGYELGIWARKK